MFKIDNELKKSIIIRDIEDINEIEEIYLELKNTF